MAEISGVNNGRVLYVTELAERLDAALDGIEAAAANPGWNYFERFNVVAGQRDYLWGAGVARAGATSGSANTNAFSALVQWGLGIMVPTLDYVILADRLRLTSDPSPADAGLGQPLCVRIRRT